MLKRRSNIFCPKNSQHKFLSKHFLSKIRQQSCQKDCRLIFVHLLRKERKYLNRDFDGFYQSPRLIISIDDIDGIDDSKFTIPFIIDKYRDIGDKKTLQIIVRCSEYYVPHVL